MRKVQLMATRTSVAEPAVSKASITSGRVPVIFPYLFLIPAFVLLILFRYFPAVSAIYHSFTDWDGTQAANFVGLKQYQALFQDPVFLLSVKNVLIYTAGRTIAA